MSTTVATKNNNHDSDSDNEKKGPKCGPKPPKGPTKPIGDFDVKKEDLGQYSARYLNKLFDKSGKGETPKVTIEEAKRVIFILMSANEFGCTLEPITLTLAFTLLKLSNLDYTTDEHQWCINKIIKNRIVRNCFSG
ncbi:hypothetical protein DLAC_09318 [Tieghemostelium lacteum]|uniref:Uncharacterized protein n=1 Tax=Tieghemostelium lacteum TaxID=361077 RepID=A0A151Z9R9_TIELA|nr:hypothetical protein DLAC_09318 [Tieghemostelium lacteum]|eukprot:KYQ90682.1 hypothetical protein DLAC_09318 [Tieghemostelium lacteum]